MGPRLMVNPEAREMFGAGCAGDPSYYQPFIDGYGSTLKGVALDVQSHRSDTCSATASSSPMRSLGVANTNRSPGTLPAQGMQSTHEVMQSHQNHKRNRGDAESIHVAHVSYHAIRVPGATTTQSILPATHSGGTWTSPCQAIQSRVDEGRMRDAGQTEVTASNDAGASLEGEVSSDRVAIGRPSLSHKSVVGNKVSKSARRGRCVSVAEATGASLSASSSSISTVPPSTPTGSRLCISSGISTNQAAPSIGRDPSCGGNTPLPGGGSANDKLERHRKQFVADNRFAAGSKISATRDRHQLAQVQKNTKIRASPVDSWGSIESTKVTISQTCSTGGTLTSEDVLGDIGFCVAPGPSDAIFLASGAGSSNEQGWLGNPGTVGMVRSLPVDGTFSRAEVSSTAGLGSPPTMIPVNSCLQQRGTMRNVIGVPGGGSGTAVRSHSMDSASYSNLKHGDHPGKHFKATSVGCTGSTGGVGSQSLQCWAWSAGGRAAVSSGDGADRASGYSGKVQSTASPIGPGLGSGYAMMPPSPLQHGSQSLSPSAKDQFQSLMSFSPLQQSNIMTGVPPLPLPSVVFRGVNMMTEAVTEEGGASAQELMSAQRTSTTASTAARLSQRPEEGLQWGSATHDTSTSTYHSKASSSGSLAPGDYGDESVV